MPAKIEIDQQRVAAFCRKHRIRKLSLFGSVLRDDFGPDSDVDVLVEFQSGMQVGLIRLAGMEMELSEIIGRKVDLNTAASLSKYYRQEILSSAQVQYDAA